MNKISGSFTKAYACLQQCSAASKELIIFNRDQYELTYIKGKHYYNVN